MDTESISKWTAMVLTRETAGQFLAQWGWQLASLLAVSVLIQFAMRGLRARYPGLIVHRFGGPVVGGAFALLVAAAFRVAGHSAALLLTFAGLCGVLLAVRGVLHTLVRFLPSGPFMRAAVRVTGWVAWALISLVLLGWLQPAMHAIEAIAIPVPGTQVSLLDAVKFVLMLLLLVFLAAYVGAFVERRMMAVTDLPIGARVGTAKVVRIVLIVMAVLISFNAAGLDLTTLTVIGGAVSVGIGFGLQRIASNFVSGFILLGDRSIRPGDVVTVGDRFGIVRELRARYVVVRDRDGVDTLIPNENIITSEVVNWSYADKHIRLKLPIQISYRDNPRKAMALLLEAANTHSRVEKSPAPAARVMQFGENGIDLELRFWIHDPEDGVNNVRSDLYLAIWDAFQAAGITIPFPQRDLNLTGDLARAVTMAAERRPGESGTAETTIEKCPID